MALVSVGVLLIRWVIRQNQPLPPRPPVQKTPTGVRPPIVFANVTPGTTISSTVDLQGLRDALTGEPLDVALGLYQCGPCTVYYHPSSVEFLRTNNGGLCISCGSSNIVPRSEVDPKERGRNYDPEIVTLSNYQHSVNRVVTFEGRAVDIRKIGDRKSSYAIMFENEPWREGFKMVVWEGHISGVGGHGFIRGLRNKKITVRGLVQKDPTFGYQIILDRRSMILDVK
ncbi:MAG: hypothetical protein HY673_01010 [Chloroflexi bacterium]|nr:hypothetical protein [Chloroflexota bacterium]